MLDKYGIDGHKMHYHVDKLASWMGENKKDVFPVYVEISPVGHCNHRCTFCAVDYLGYKVRSLDINRMHVILCDMGKHEIRSIMWAGEGEPLLHPELYRMINWASDFKIDNAITTNGVALTEKFLERCGKNISWIKVSLNAGTKEDYINVHKAKDQDWDKVWENLSTANLLRKRYKWPLTIGVQAVLLPENRENIKTLVLLAKAKELDYVVIKPYSQHKKSLTRDYESVNYDTTEYNTILLELENMSTDNTKVIVRHNAIEVKKEGIQRYHKCYATPYFWAYIMSTGDVYGCSAYLADDKFRYGNINTELFSSIWLGNKRIESIDYISNKLNISDCRLNCRMDKVNQYLHELKYPGIHRNFI